MPVIYEGGRCLTDIEIVHYSDGKMSPDEKKRVREHLENKSPKCECHDKLVLADGDYDVL